MSIPKTHTVQKGEMGPLGMWRGSARQEDLTSNCGGDGLFVHHQVKRLCKTASRIHVHNRIFVVGGAF